MWFINTLPAVDLFARLIVSVNRWRSRYRSWFLFFLSFLRFSSVCFFRRCYLRSVIRFVPTFRAINHWESSLISVWVRETSILFLYTFVYVSYILDTNLLGVYLFSFSIRLLVNAALYGKLIFWFANNWWIYGSVFCAVN